MAKESFSDMDIEHFLTLTASSAPAPGGGGIAALTAASAAALLEMVASLTLHKKGYEAVQPLMEQIQGQAAALRQRYLQGIEDDAQAFENVIHAVRLPKDFPDRSAIVQQAFKEAAAVPFQLGKDIFVLLQLADQAVQFGNIWVITDGAIAAMNARAAMRSAFYSVRINLKSIRDEAYVNAVDQEMTHIEEQAALVEASVEASYQKRQ